LTELNKLGESQGKYIEKLKKERRRMEELVSLKESQVDRLESEKREINNRM
jgi:hypothetical protein